MGSELRSAAAEDPGPAAPDHIDADEATYCHALCNPHVDCDPGSHPDVVTACSATMAERLEYWSACW